MNPLNIAIGFIPLTVFALLVNWLPLGWAAAVGLAVAVVIIAATAARGGVMTLSVAQFVTLAVFTVVGFTAGPAATTFEPYARGAASLALGAFILATSFSFPFTVQYARRSVPQQYWKNPQFLAVNRRISRAWGLAVLAIGVGHLGAAYVGGNDQVLRFLLDWGVPVFAAYRAYSVTKRTIAQNTHTPQPDGTRRPTASPAH